MGYSWVIGGLANALRGGQYEIWEHKPAGYKPPVRWRFVNASLFGIAALLIHFDPILAAAAMPAMLLGAAPGWGDYIGALGGWRKDNLKEQWFIDPLIKKLITKPRWWGFAGLTLRGLFWGAVVSIPYWALGYTENAVFFLIHGLMMGCVYWLAIEWMRTRVDRPGDGWGLGEIFFGMLLWSKA